MPISKTLAHLQDGRSPPTGRIPATLAHLQPGGTAESALQEGHPDVGFMDRFRIMFRGGDQAAGQRLLESRGFEAQAMGGSQYAVRKPGEEQWRLLDEPGASLQDITDVAGDVLSLGGTIGGGIVGAPGGIAGGAAGAALGSAGATGLRQILSGLPATTEEITGELGEAALTGATAELGGRVLGGAARGLRGLSRARPSRGIQSVPRINLRPTPARTTRTAEGLRRVGEGLEAPGRFLERMTGSAAGRLLRSPVGTAAGFSLGGPVGAAVGASGLMGAAGRGLGKVSRALMKDTSGRPLLFLLNRAGRKIGGKIERALQLAGNPQMRMAYRAAIFQLLQDPEFRALLRPPSDEEEEIQAPGVEGSGAFVASPGARSE